MPNRILRDGLRSSATINRLSDRAHRLYTHLIVAVDDFGLCEWNTTWVKATAIPLLLWTEEELSTVMDEISSARLVKVYEHEGKNYAAMERWDQRRNAKHPKFPMPPTEEHIRGGYVPPKARAAEARVLRSPPRVNGSGWDRSNDGILAKATELGINTRGESADTLRRLCFAELERRKGQ